jgi:hypothetical protein
MNRFACAIVLLLSSELPTQADSRDADAETFFETKIRPVLANSCHRCHGGEKVSNGLRVDSRDDLLRGGESGPAIIPGDPENSLLIRAIRQSGAELKMPPNKRLTDAQISDLVRWVSDKAPWPNSRRLKSSAAARHWAFQPVRASDPPRDPSDWSQNPIDRFISAQRRRRGLQPVALAEKGALIRRVYFDLIGLPPAPEDVDGFVAETSSAAYTGLVDRLLASPQYGERWGRHWMDVARYADTAGDNADYPVPEAHLYRDYIIDSFNADKPYDQFVREQLAGDILAKHARREKYAEQVVATGFLALSRRYATGPYELWHLTLEDAIETTGRAFMGLTLRCARCHDHKFDPVSKEDYYALYGIFASSQFPWAGAEEFASMKRPRDHFAALVPEAEANKYMLARQRELERLEIEIKKAEKDSPLAKRLRADRERLLRSNLPGNLPGAYAVQEGKPINVNIQTRGEVNQLGPVVKRNVIKFLSVDCPVIIPESASGRLELAEWLTRSEHPLTARVMVNRIWQHHFGKGLVGTPSNLGLRGDDPSHPELLDWLAAEFVKSGWSIKAMHRLILSSKTYQLSSGFNQANAANDPGNRWYWRFDRRRLDAEAIRDAILAVSANLDLKRPGGHPFPPIDQWGWTQHNPFKGVYPTNHRSVYLMTQRLQRHPFLALFDGPDTNTTTDVRSSSTVPLQALFMMNNGFMTEQAQSFAKRLVASSSEPRIRIDVAHRLAWSRLPRSDEVDKGMRYLDTCNQCLIEAGTPSERVELETWTSYSRVVLSANEFVYVD